MKWELTHRIIWLLKRFNMFCFYMYVIAESLVNFEPII